MILGAWLAGWMMLLVKKAEKWQDFFYIQVHNTHAIAILDLYTHIYRTIRKKEEKEEDAARVAENSSGRSAGKN